MTPLSGQVALVIGGTRGIGAAISRRLARDGAALAVLYRDRHQDAERLTRNIAATGGGVRAVAAEAGDAAALVDGIDAVLCPYDRLDIVVNVAGMAVTGPLDDHPMTRSTACSRSTCAHCSSPPATSRRGWNRADASS